MQDTSVVVGYILKQKLVGRTHAKAAPYNFMHIKAHKCTVYYKFRGPMYMCTVHI